MRLDLYPSSPPDRLWADGVEAPTKGAWLLIQWVDYTVGLALRRRHVTMEAELAKTIGSKDQSFEADDLECGWSRCLHRHNNLGRNASRKAEGGVITPVGCRWREGDNDHPTIQGDTRRLPHG